MDIDKLKQYTKQLELAEERRHLALSLNNVGIWEWNMKTGHLYWDDNMFRIYGIHPAEFHNRYEDWSARVHPEDLEICRKKIKECIDHGQPYVFRFRVKHSDDREAVVAGFGGCIRDKNGGAEKIIGVNVLEGFLYPEHYQRVGKDPCPHCPSLSPSFLKH